MSYNLNDQYRCTIIRGRGQRELEDLLPLYANMVSQTCPCGKDEFKSSCQKILANALFNTPDFDGLTKGNKKTINNHITEIAGALLGLYLPVMENGETVIYESSSCHFLIEHQDYPTFFKNICLHFQFPNGAKKPQTCAADLDNKIKFKPYCFIISLLYYAQTRPNPVLLSKQEIGFYALNNLEVLQGKVSCKDVYNAIISDRAIGEKHDKIQGSNEWQHIKEQFNWLSLTNLVRTDQTYIWLNKEEAESIALFIKSVNDFGFDAYSYDFSTSEGREKYYLDWKKFYSSFNTKLLDITSPIPSDIIIVDKNGLKAQKTAIKSTTDLGDNGETLVYQLEVERIKAFKPRLANKVLLMGKTKGLGYDVLSLEGDEMPDDPEMNRFIEVKATRRTTIPNFNNKWVDSINLTAKEWSAAKQHGKYYNIYRVYFTQSKVIVIRVNNPYLLSQTNRIDVFPTVYQMDFNASVIEQRYVSE